MRTIVKLAKLVDPTPIDPVLCKKLDCTDTLRAYVFTHACQTDLSVSD